MTLSPSQIKAAELISRGVSQTETAKILGVDRKTIQRWLKITEFKNLTFGLSKTPNSSSPAKTPKTNFSQPEAARIQDLVPLAIKSLQEILGDSEIRVSDRLKCIQIIFSCGVGRDVEELEALRLLISSGWLPREMLSPAGQAVHDLRDTMRELFGELKPNKLQLDPESFNDLISRRCCYECFQL